MSEDQASAKAVPSRNGTDRPLTDAARRALAEAEARRAAEREIARPPELHGRDGPEPTRYGDWETKGIVSDF